MHEVLSKTKSSFDPLTTLCEEDVEILKDGDISIIRLHLKSPKEKRIGTGIKLEIFENKSFCCPIRAWVKWHKKVFLNSGCPVFLENGQCFTGQDFNKILSELTLPIMRGTDGLIRPHSFRSGVASEMGLRGFEEKSFGKRMV